VAYTLTPFRPNVKYQDQVKVELSLANTNFSLLGQAFLNNDPTQPILRAVYIGITAPTNPVAGTTWLDVSTSTPTLKVYDGTNWQVVLGSSRVDLTNATSDYLLKVGEEAIINFTNTTNVPLHIATQSGTLYNLYVYLTNPTFELGNGVIGSVLLLPNNTYYSDAFYRAGILVDSNISHGYINYRVSGLELAYDYFPANCFSIIYNETGHKSATSFSIHSGFDYSNFARWQSENCVWIDFTTEWTSLGTITFPQPTTGFILVRRLA
jgi:hypothetical protein